MLTLQRRAATISDSADEIAFFHDGVAAYTWARDVAGLAATTLEKLTKPVIELCDFYDTVPWRLTPRQLDCYFAGPGKRSHRTVRQKMVTIDSFFALLEQRYAGEILRRFGAAVESPADPFDRPRHRGEYGLRIPPRSGRRQNFPGRVSGRPTCSPRAVNFCGGTSRRSAASSRRPVRTVCSVVALGTAADRRRLP
ncbi:hypothetical protein ABT373_39960 [Streptomyces sp. NPDC000070]|uniref:hypothetical protein n=1 Tax=Streptomyces sp. NPDC000070 TaxID=3154240 RepID=UPI00331D79FD